MSWKYASLLLGIILIISLVFTFVIFRNHKKEEYRGTTYPLIKLIMPIKGKYHKSLLEFRWEEIRNVDYYILELFDESLKPLWKSNKIKNNYIVLPHKYVAGLPENKMYFWVLRAYLPSGKIIESEIEDFILTK